MNKVIVIALFLVYFVHSTSSCVSSSTMNVTNNKIPFSTRAYWMRRANTLLSELVSPCPVYPYAAVVVNHTANRLGELVCTGVNQVGTAGNPSWHGEMVAINNCSAILTDKKGRYRLSPDDAISAFFELSIYSNAESCPMCASAIRWSGFKEYIYGTSIKTLIEEGWEQISIDSHSIFSASDRLPTTTAYIPNVLSNETDPYFTWQYNPTNPCPSGCQRSEVDSVCMPY